MGAGEEWLVAGKGRRRKAVVRGTTSIQVGANAFMLP